jgi:hypothetical protein
MGDFLDGLIIGIIVFSGISGILIAAITSDEYNKVYTVGDLNEN